MKDRLDNRPIPVIANGRRVGYVSRWQGWLAWAWAVVRRMMGSQ